MKIVSHGVNSRNLISIYFVTCVEFRNIHVKRMAISDVGGFDLTFNKCCKSTILNVSY